MFRNGLNWLAWKLWRCFPGWMPWKYQRQILKLSPYVCEQIGQGSPMVVMRREVWEAGEYEDIPEAPLNRDGERWIIQQWLRAHPDWRPVEQDALP